MEKVDFTLRARREQINVGFANGYGANMRSMHSKATPHVGQTRLRSRRAQVTHSVAWLQGTIIAVHARSKQMVHVTWPSGADGSFSIASGSRGFFFLRSGYARAVCRPKKLSKCESRGSGGRPKKLSKCESRGSGGPKNLWGSGGPKNFSYISAESGTRFAMPMRPMVQ